LSAHPGLPAVLDPVLSSGSGTALADRALRAMLVRTLAPRCVLLTPNAPEARALAERQDLGDCAAFLTQQGCPAVLITGTHEPDAQVLHRLYGPDGLLWEGAWERLPGSFHGSGCTLASAAATGLAQGKDLQTAVQDALSYTWNSLQQALTTGRCQFTPNRLYRCRTYAD
jgi:hydroxymethylpyrimidine/phosphomethylpyrimidine kinase